MQGMSTCQLVPGTRCSFKCMSGAPEICTNECDDCGFSRGTCQLIPFTQCSFKCVRNALEMCPNAESNDCGFEMKCRDQPGASCQLVPGTRCSVRCMRTFTAPTTLPTRIITPEIFTRPIRTTTPTPKPTPTPTAAPPMMRIEMCLLPGNHGRSSGRPLANLGFEVVVVQCRPHETCVESDDSKILGNPLG